MFHYYMFNKPFGCVTARRDSPLPNRYGLFFRIKQR